MDAEVHCICSSFYSYKSKELMKTQAPQKDPTPSQEHILGF